MLAATAPWASATRPVAGNDTPHNRARNRRVIIVILAGGSLTIDLNAKGNLRVYVLSTSATPAPGKIGSATTYLK